MRKPRILVYAVLVLPVICHLLTSCDRRPLEDLKQDAAQIPIKIYWDKADVVPQNATILFYDDNGNLYKEWQAASKPEYAEGSILLDPGHYTAVVFNELRSQINNIQMQNWNKFSTFEAIGVRNLNPVYDFASREKDEVLVRQPGILSACITSFDIGETSGGCGLYNPESGDYYALSDLHPTRKTTLVNILVHVNGLNNARMPAIAELRNTASGYIFPTDRNTLSLVSTQFTIGNRVYNPGSTTNGTVSTVINAFGIPGDRYNTEDNMPGRMYLDLAFMLADAKMTIVEYSIDVTDLLKVTTNPNEGVTIDIEVTIGQLPVVKPVNGSSGFDTELVDWDKVIIPLQQ